MAGVVAPLLCPPLARILIPGGGARSCPIRARRYEIRPSYPSALSTSRNLSSNQKALRSPLIPRASVGTAGYTVEPGTNVKFPRELKVPGCAHSLVLLGTGYREKVFAIIGVKVYAAGFYVKHSVTESLDTWKGKSATEIIEDMELFDTIFKAPMEKSLKIELVRDVDGKTFWNALDEAISPRVKAPTANDDSALSTFCNTFQGRDLKKGTSIYLTWVRPSKMLVSVSSDGLPANVDAEIESLNVNLALYHAFLGDSPVSPTLKTSVAVGITMMLY